VHLLLVVQFSFKTTMTGMLVLVTETYMFHVLLVHGQMTY
jgi:hypothetical protein